MNIKYYDERYYLTMVGVLERRMLELWRDKIDEEKSKEIINYSYLIDKYNQYINIVSKLVEELSLKDNSISMALIISALIESSTFSYCSFTKDSCEDILISKLGLNILNGTGCCRNVSSFINDIFNVLDRKNDVLTVIKLEENNKKKALTSKANHMINLIYYNNTPYGFDMMSNMGSLYYFKNAFELLPLDLKEESYMHYKPYMELVYQGRSFEYIKEKLKHLKERGRMGITQEEFKEIITETDEKLCSNISLVKDFLFETNDRIESINEKIKSIKRKL